MRASDADRERVVNALRDAVADGRLTPAEHEERITAAYEARTLGELSGLTSDLLAPDRQPLQTDVRPVQALFRSDERRGRWVVPPHLSATAMFGTATLDLREALLQSNHVVIQANVVCGTLNLIVPEGVRVVMPASATLASKTNHVPTPPGEGPVVEVTGYLFLGSVTAKSPKRSRLRGMFSWRSRS